MKNYLERPWRKRAQRLAVVAAVAAASAVVILVGSLGFAMIADGIGAKIARSIWAAMNAQRQPDFSERKGPI